MPREVCSPLSITGSPRSGERTGVSPLSSPRADARGSFPVGKVRPPDQSAPHSPAPVQGTADPVPGGPQIGPGEPGFRTGNPLHG
jgi:hypothetical protein